MLVLSRRIGESVMIGDGIEIMLVDIRGSQVRIGIRASSETAIHRREVYDAIQREKGLNDDTELA